MDILSHVERKKIDEHFMLACSRGAYHFFCAEKVDGALIGVGALKGTNTVLDNATL